MEKKFLYNGKSVGPNGRHFMENRGLFLLLNKYINSHRIASMQFRCEKKSVGNFRNCLPLSICLLLYALSVCTCNFFCYICLCSWHYLLFIRVFFLLVHFTALFFHQTNHHHHFMSAFAVCFVVVVVVAVATVTLNKIKRIKFCFHITRLKCMLIDTRTPLCVR